MCLRSRIMGGAGLGSANDGSFTPTFWPTWATVHLDAPLSVSTTTATTSRETAPGERRAIRQTIAVAMWFWSGLVAVKQWPNGHERRGCHTAACSGVSLLAGRSNVHCPLRQRWCAMPHRLSFSKLGLATKCLYGFRGDVPTFERPTGDAAAKGRIVHSLVEARVTGHAAIEDANPHLLSEAKAVFEGPLVGFVDSRKWTVCERGYRYDSIRDTCANGPRRGEPAYDDVPDHVLYGTVDLVAIEDDTAIIIDIKTGRPPEDSEQLYGQAVAVSRRFGVSNARVMYARALKTKLELLNEELLDADRLDAEAGRIRRRLRLRPNAEPNPGDHCWKCDAWQACPAKREERDRYVEHEPPPAALYADDARLF